MTWDTCRRSCARWPDSIPTPLGHGGHTCQSSGETDRRTPWEHTSIMALTIIPGDLGDPRVRALLDHHATTARAETGRGSAHALGSDGLNAPDITFWTAWDD